MTPAERKEALKLIYRHTHKDAKGIYSGGVKTLLVLREHGTCAVSLDGLTDAEIADRLPYARKMEERRLLKKREQGVESVDVIVTD